MCIAEMHYGNCTVQVSPKEFQWQTIYRRSIFFYLFQGILAFWELFVKRNGHKLSCFTAHLFSPFPPSIWHQARKKKADAWRWWMLWSMHLFLWKLSILLPEINTGKKHIVPAVCDDAGAEDSRTRPLEGIIESCWKQAGCIVLIAAIY